MGIADVNGPAPVPTVPGRVPLTDGMRAVAATLVLFTHVAFSSFGRSDVFWHRALFHGDLGVPLFFGLSGLLLTRMWTRKRAAGQPYPSVKRYLKHRVARILPAYYLVLIAVVLTVGSDAPAAKVVSNVLFLQVYTADFLPAFVQTWSLCTEVAFYAVLPLLGMWVASRRSVRGALSVCAGLAAVSVATWAFMAATASFMIDIILANSLLGHACWFAAGMALAVLEPALRTDRGAWWQRPALWLVVLAGILALILTPLGGAGAMTRGAEWQPLSKELLYGAFALVGIGFLLLPRASRTWPGRFLGSAAMSWFGKISYSFFLWQMLLIWGVRWAVGLPRQGGGFWITLAVSFVVCLAVSYLTWRLVERPVMAWVERRRPATSPTAQRGTAQSGTASTAGTVTDAAEPA